MFKRLTTWSYLAALSAACVFQLGGCASVKIPLPLPLFSYSLDLDALPRIIIAILNEELFG
ncbi:MAG: hypothetical protein GXY55_07745 [Phycisphaerae bacterium]|jgi:hypothetical protein|nr:hypothetical protein [Phycisphaerae bacterium]